jgi:hypothetical protein
MTRRAMPAVAADRLDDDLASARDAARAGEEAAAWGFLEEAHVLSQPWAWPHIKVHAAMLALGWRNRDRREVTGQLLRIVVAGPGSLTGRYPEGNTGRASIPATRPMPVPADLRALLEASDG